MSQKQGLSVQSPHMLDFISHAPAQTQRVGQRLGELLRPGDLVLLLGPFGAGKTHFVKGVGTGLGSDDLVTSPSFVLINQYEAGPTQGRFPIWHVDLYRVEEPGELENIGLDECLDGSGVCLIEWAEHAAGWLPHEHLAVRFQHLSETKRVLRFEPRGTRYVQLVEALKAAAFG
jgi:tRNA threonylcarbamoyladenosine biosynthesis protein TsaE